jgi:hypothetical protein
LRNAITRSWFEPKAWEQPVRLAPELAERISARAMTRKLAAIFDAALQPGTAPTPVVA